LIDNCSIDGVPIDDNAIDNFSINDVSIDKYLIGDVSVDDNSINGVLIDNVSINDVSISKKNFGRSNESPFCRGRFNSAGNHILSSPPITNPTIIFKSNEDTQ
jgi:hypothetical protein